MPLAFMSCECCLTAWTATVAEHAIGRNARSVEGAWRASGTDVTRMAEPVSIKAAWRPLFSSHIIEVSQDDEDAIRILAVDCGLSGSHCVGPEKPSLCKHFHQFACWGAIGRRVQEAIGRAHD